MSNLSITVSSEVVFSERFRCLGFEAQALYYRLMFAADPDGYVKEKAFDEARADGFGLAPLVELCAGGLVYACTCGKLFVSDYDIHRRAHERAVEDWEEEPPF